MAIKEFKDYPNTSTPLNAENINEVITTILGILGLDVDTYNPSSEYGVDDFVVYQKELWRCIEETTGEWNEEDWVKDSILVPKE